MRLPSNKLDSVDELCQYVDELISYDYEDVDDELSLVEEDLGYKLDILQLRMKLGLDTDLPKIIAKQYRRL